MVMTGTRSARCCIYRRERKGERALSGVLFSLGLTHTHTHTHTHTQFQKRNKESQLSHAWLHCKLGKQLQLLAFCT